MSYLDDPRVFFAAERTLLAWQRTAIAMIGLGLVIERFGLFLRFVNAGHVTTGNGRVTLAAAVLFLLCGAFVAVISTVQYRRFLRELSAPEIPRGHMTWPGPAMNSVLAFGALSMAFWFVLGE
jgi:putative membrane protein